MNTMSCAHGGAPGGGTAYSSPSPEKVILVPALKPGRMGSSRIFSVGRPGVSDLRVTFIFLSLPRYSSSSVQGKLCSRSGRWQRLALGLPPPPPPIPASISSSPPCPSNGVSPNEFCRLKPPEKELRKDVGRVSSKLIARAAAAAVRKAAPTLAKAAKVVRVAVRGRRRRPASLEPLLAISVKHGALVRVGEDVVCLGHLLEPLLRSLLLALRPARPFVGVPLHGGLSVRLFDVGILGVLGDAELSIVIAAHVGGVARMA
mmetsp:Transcript_50099/g.163677  ORF Transcript_50099/g.163677 Transcript_50099/m.163677 type:complete len:260 (+) Transcript_50099:658-1437(+)